MSVDLMVPDNATVLISTTYCDGSIKDIIFMGKGSVFRENIQSKPVMYLECDRNATKLIAATGYNVGVVDREVMIRIRAGGIFETSVFIDDRGITVSVPHSVSHKLIRASNVFDQKRINSTKSYSIERNGRVVSPS